MRQGVLLFLSGSAAVRVLHRLVYKQQEFIPRGP